MTMRVWRRALALAAALPALTACGSDPEPTTVRGAETLAVYRCEGDRQFQARFRAGEAAVTLEIEGKTLVLPQVRSGSGIAYSDGTLTFRAKGREAFTEGWPGGDFTGCSQDT